jgi:hypothetical protein
LECLSFERIATSEKARGEFLDETFQEHDVIWDSDQGRSLRAFWGFLMSPKRQQELERLLDRIYPSHVNSWPPCPPSLGA